MMLTCFILIYLMVAVLFERYASMRWKNACAVLLTVMALNNAVMANIGYYYMDRSYKNSYSVAMEMMTRINRLDSDATQILVIGEALSDYTLEANDPKAGKIHILGGLLEANLLFNSEHLVPFLNETFYKTYTRAFLDPASDPEMAQAIEKMGCWPENDSIQVLDDVIVIKLK